MIQMFGTVTNMHELMIDTFHGMIPRWEKAAKRKNTMGGPGSIRPKTMVVAVDGPHGVPWGGRGLGMLGNLLYYLDCTLKMS